jgi:hypothetical protein
MPKAKLIKATPHKPALRLYFRVQCQLDKSIRTTRSYWHKIITIKHPRLKGKTAQVKQVLKNPDLIRQSKSNKRVYLYYQKQNRHYICVVARHLNGNGFIITSYLTSKILEGKLIWTKKSTQSKSTTTTRATP